MSPDTSDIERELATLEADLKRLEAEYNMFFAGRLPRPPWETRARVEAIVKRIDRSSKTNYGEKFRFDHLLVQMLKKGVVKANYARFLEWYPGQAEPV